MKAIEKPSSPSKKQRLQQNNKNQYTQSTNFQTISQSAFDNIACALGGGKETKNGDGWLTCCPVHGDTNPSLSIVLSNGRLILNCHAGCDWRTVMDEIRDMGLLPNKPSLRIEKNLPAYIWDQSVPNDKKIKEYLATRKIEIKKIPDCIRWNQYKEPMLVARVSKPGDCETVAIHRTFLDEKLKKTDRKMLGPCKGRAVWLSAPQNKIIVGEGLETTLSAMAAIDLPGVACLSASGMKVVKIPEQVNEIIILVDSDQNHVGQNAAMDLAKRFEGTAYFATPCDSCFTPHPEKMDFNDLAQGEIHQRFEQLITMAEITDSCSHAEISLFDDDGKPKTKTTVLIEIGSQYELFHDETGEGYASITMNGHRETWPINSKVFTELLADRYFILSNKGVSRNVVKDATDTLRGQARVHGKQHKIYRRTAALDGKIFIDLCDSQWRAVEISMDSWRIVANPQIKFLRSPSSKALPLPVSGGSINDLWPIINVRPIDRPLVAGFLVRSLYPNPPYFGLCVIGEQGTGKSIFTTILRALCDPSTAMLRPPQKTIVIF